MIKLTKKKAHEISVSNEPLAIDEVKSSQEPVSIGSVETHNNQAYDTPSPTQRHQHKIWKTQYVSTVETCHQQQPNLLPGIYKFISINGSEETKPWCIWSLFK